MITLFCGFGYMVLLFVGFVLLPGWTLGFLGYMSCFVGANLLLSVPIYLWLRKHGFVRFSALCSTGCSTIFAQKGESKME